MPRTTRNPILLKSGTVVESATDLLLAGPGITWTQTRSYDSGLTGAGVLGNRWVTANTEMCLVTSVSGKDMLYTANSKISFTGDDTAGYTPPPGRRLTLEHNSGNQEYRLTNVDTGALTIFHDFTVSTALDRGRLKEATSRAWNAAGKSGITYSYTYASDLLASVTITTSGDQASGVTSTFSSGLLRSLSVSDGGTLVKKVEYFYIDNGVTGASAEAGSAGDLVHVKVSSRAAGDPGGTLSIERHTLYRYATGSRLKGVYEHGAIVRALDRFSESDPQWLLTQDDDYNGGSGTKVEDFASRWFTYYTSDATTNNIATLWNPGGEDLHSSYGGANRDETNFVASERVDSAACTSCGGSASGLTRGYYYMQLNQGAANDDNEVKYLVVEDTKNASGAQYRKIFGLNADGRTLREVTIDNPNSSPKYWCQSWKLTLTDDWNGKTPNPKLRYHITEYRPPSAHDVSSSTIDEFLDPFDDGNGGSPSWTNDTATLRPASDPLAGPTTVFAYDANGRMTEKRVKQGHNASNAYFVKGLVYGNGMDAPTHLQVAIYNYPTQQTTLTNGVAISLSYEFWDDDPRQPKKVTTTYPTIPTSQNGSGVTATAELWYDKAGRLRWAKDAEGYVTYYSYHTATGNLGYTAVDVDPATAPAGATDSQWISWTDDGDGDSTYDSGDKPTRGGGLPTALALVTRQEFDIQGRPTLLTEPGGDRHYTLHETNRTIEFPYLHTSTDKPQMPTHVRVLNDKREVAEEYSVRADYSAISVDDDVPTDFSTEPTQADYVSWTRYHYDDQSGHLSKVDRYFNIPSSGGTSDSDVSTYYNRTVFKYDVEGRRTHTIQQVAGAPGSSGSGVEQVTQTVYDKFGRVTEIKQGVSSASHNMGDDYSSYPTMATVSKTFYDFGDDTTPLQVGDGHITTTRSYFGTGSNDYTRTLYFRTWRGHVRSVVGATSGSTFLLPYHVSSLDWMGRDTVSAAYTNGSAWSSVLSGNDGYADNISAATTGRNDLTKTHYNNLGHVYRVETFPGTEGTKHFETNNYYDRSGRLVATGQKHQAHQEYAYDGAGRQYQQRTVIELATPDGTYGQYTSGGAFNYVAPAPKPLFSAMSGGNGGVIELTHTGFDGENATEMHSVEINHDDANGFSLSSGTPSGGVRQTVFIWYDDLDRPTTTADFGSRDEDDGNSSWAAADVPDRPSEPPASTANMLVTKLGYEATTGQLSVVTDPKGNKTKTFYDDAGRRVAVAENWDDYDGPGDEADAGGGTNHEQDRVTKFAYNGLSQQTLLTAVNVTSSGTVNQETKYYYVDSYNASLVTHTAYPDSTDTPSSGTDLVKLEYNLDGSLKKKTDQRGVIIEYTYDDARRLAREGATTIPGGVDNTIRSIVPTYDLMGRPEKITSYANADGTSTIHNEIKYTYGSEGLVTKTEQSHQNAVTSGTLSVQYAYDDTASSNVYTNGLRLKMVTYPKDTRKIHSTYGSSGVADVLDRVDMFEADNGSGSPGTDLVQYSYNGTARLALVNYGVPDVQLDLFQGTSGTYAGYDRFGRTVRQEWDKYGTGAGVRERFDYTYDDAGSRLTRDVRVDLVNGGYPNTRDQKYAYDGLERLLNYDQGTLSSGSITSSNKQRSWKLDQLGNWSETFTDLSQTTSEQTRTHNAVNELTAIDSVSTHVAEDEAGNMTKIPQPASWSAHFVLKYDAWNRMVEIRDGSNNLVQQNEFDGLGRRIVRSPASGADRHYYYNEQWQLVEERLLVAGELSHLHQFLWHPYYIDALAVRYDDDNTDESGITDYYSLHDANYNVTAVALNNGNVVERYAYSPYGEVTVLDADFAADADNQTDIANTHFYTGREADPDTKLQLNRHRFYSAILGRWTTRDPIGYVSEIFNLYEYSSNPLSATDPSGLDIWNPPSSGNPPPNFYPGSTYRGKRFCSVKDVGRTYTWRTTCDCCVKKSGADGRCSCFRFYICKRSGHQHFFAFWEDDGYICTSVCQ